MKLTGREIVKQMEAGKIIIEDFNEAQLNPNSYNLRLDDQLLIYDRLPKVQRTSNATSRSPDMAKAMYDWSTDRRLNGWGNIGHNHPELAVWEDVLDMAVENIAYELRIPKGGVVLIPGRLYLAQTVEYTETHGFVPCIDGRSSIGRLGISIHATAGFGDTGFCGNWTLELAVTEPVRVYAGVQFCQISYETVLGEIQEYRSNKYQGQRSPRPSAIWKEFQNGQS